MLLVLMGLGFVLVPLGFGVAFTTYGEVAFLVRVTCILSSFTGSGVRVSRPYVGKDTIRAAGAAQGPLSPTTTVSSAANFAAETSTWTTVTVSLEIMRCAAAKTN